MKYSLELSRQAARYFDRLDVSTQARVAEVLRAVTQDPLGPASKPLAGYPGERSARVGSLRVLFALLEDRAVVRVWAIGPRGQIYRQLGR